MPSNKHTPFIDLVLVLVICFAISFIKGCTTVIQVNRAVKINGGSIEYRQYRDSALNRLETQKRKRKKVAPLSLPVHPRSLETLRKNITTKEY